MRKQRGFSLIELLVVVGIILIIAAIAIPNLMRARMAANEASAMSSVRTISHAQVTYSIEYPTEGYADTLAKLGTPITGCVAPTLAKACLLDPVLSSGNKSGYSFGVTAAGQNAKTVYTVNADPSMPGRTGTRYFFTDDSMVIRFSVTARALLTDPAVD